MQTIFTSTAPVARMMSRMALLLECLIPQASNRWPRASDCVDLDTVTFDIFSNCSEDWADALLSEIESAPASDRAVLLRRAEAADPARFERLVGACYRAYYTTPAAQAVIRDLAEAGPREPSPLFDEDLLAQVKTRRR
jgi:hypothetical protein